ncbi:MAG: lysylphosphatidylglycerol synthase domain-containing protein [Chitinophagaceae bacterium]
MAVRQLMHSLQGSSLGLILLLFVLMLGNWGIEAYKWQLVIRPLHPLPWTAACKAILAGNALAFFTPNRIGEYMGRILFLPASDSLQAISLTIVASLSQNLITFFWGIWGWIVLRTRIQQQWTTGAYAEVWTGLFLAVVAAVFLLLLLVYFRIPSIVNGLLRFPRLGRLRQLLQVLAGCSRRLLLQLLLLSGFRYLIFFMQYFICFRLFQVMLQPDEAFWSLSVIFLLMAIIPTVAAFTDLGFRGKISLDILQLFNNNILGILGSSLAIWMINLVLPAIGGSLLLLNSGWKKQIMGNRHQQALVKQSGSDNT